MNTSFQLYRGAKVGECLRQSLFELMESEKISYDVADRVLSQFDKSMYEALEQKINTKAQLKGKLKTYNYIDNVWQFVLAEVSLKLTSSGQRGPYDEAKMDSARLICVDSKLVKEEREGREREAELLAQAQVKLEAAKDDPEEATTATGVVKKEGKEGKEDEEGPKTESDH